jgi:pyridoxamine 5'-phosphate oxidase family protein
MSTPTIAPTEIPKSNKPISAVDACTALRIAGVRVTHVAVSAPRLKSAIHTDSRHLRVARDSRIESQTDGRGLEGDVDFTAAEYEYLRTLGHGRLSSIGRDGLTQFHPVRFVVDTESSCLEFGRARLWESVKYRNIRRDPRVSITVEDNAVSIPGLVSFGSRGIEIRGLAETTWRSADVIRLRPMLVISWNIDRPGRHTRFLK